MKTLPITVAVALAALLPASVSAGSAFADRVVDYQPGIWAAPGFTQPESALGAPSQINPFGENTDPFNPPYGKDQVVSIGRGGWLILRFDTPILNHPLHPAGLDFTIFGNAGFIITNDFDLSTYNWIGEPATDGTLFGQATGSTRISVSRDGMAYYVLDPRLAPSVDQFAPTDAAGDPHLALDPVLGAADFAGATLEGIRSLYRGSAGGASYDISWARDIGGVPVFLPEIRYIRIEVLNGRAEIDAVSVVSWPAQSQRSR